MSAPAMPCPVCRAPAPEPFFELLGVPVFCNVLHASPAKASVAPRGDIRLAFCRTCGMVYNQAFDPARVRYSPAYENAQHGSDRFRRYAARLAAGLKERHDLRRKTIVEIGCGDGHFLRLLCNGGGNRGWGFDPACSAASGDETYVRDRYRADGEPDAVDFFFCRHVLEHLEDPRALLREVRRAAENATVYFEVPDASWTLLHGGVWDILYEHCSYFTENSLRRLFVAEGFAVTRTATAFDGQFLQIEAAAGAPQPASGGAAPAECAAAIERFRRDYGARLARWRERLAELTGRRIALWGAGTKGVMFLNALDANGRIGCAVDVNPKKQGMYVAGTGHPIVSPELLREWRPDVVLVMNPAYTDEIGKQLRALDLRTSLEAA